MSLRKISLIKNALLRVSDNVGHYEALKKTDKYIVWAEDGEGGSLEANNKKEIQVVSGTIDYFTKEDMDPDVNKIQEELEKDGISFYYSSIQYEEETGYIHHEWVWEVS